MAKKEKISDDSFNINGMLKDLRTNKDQKTMIEEFVRIIQWSLFVQ
jgi:hypothetical protein